METLLNKTYKILNQKSEQEKLNDFHLTKPERPTKDVYFNPFNIPDSRQKSKTKEQLLKYLNDNFGDVGCINANGHIIEIKQKEGI